ncbi:uncharacterized protein V1518DRAFT_417582 [Limtongia smithiae]|uniref:uncharacterized protein n=1 Tax=Limtongia smithiae TaxID=1125753 RepID=UPI0034CF8169
MFSEYASKFLPATANTADRDASSPSAMSSASGQAGPSPTRLSLARGQPPSRAGTSSQASTSTSASRLFHSAVETVSELEDSRRSRYLPRRIWVPANPQATARMFPGRSRQVPEEDEYDPEDDRDSALMGPEDQQQLLQSQRHAPQPGGFFTGRRSLFFKSAAPSTTNSIIGATNHGELAGNSRIHFDTSEDDVHDEAQEHMTGTYTGHLYGAESVIRSSWKPYDEEEGGDEATSAKQRPVLRRSVSSDADDANELSEVLSSRNSLESVGLESVMSRTRRQSPPPARLRFNEHPFPRNMTTATMNNATANRRLYFEDFGASDAEVLKKIVADTDIAIPIPADEPAGFKDAPEDLPPRVFDELPISGVPANPAIIGDGYVPPSLNHVTSLRSQDRFWGNLYIFSMCSLFATSFVVFLETEVVTSISLPDSIYTAIGGSISVLALDTFVAVAISAIWFVVLRKCVKPALYVLMVSIPFLLVGLTMYPLIMSYRDSWGGNTAQDKAMRWTSLIPTLTAVFWVWFIMTNRRAIGHAIGIVQLACNILNENQALIWLSLGTLLSFVLFTWLWVAMFARVFLKGTIIVGKTGISTWILDQNSWFLGAWYCLMFLWSWGVFSGVQRAATSITVSQWYFHRQELPLASSNVIVSTSLGLASTVYFGTSCFASIVALLVRLPLLMLPRQVAAFVQSFMMNLVPGPITSLTNPLTLSYSAMTSQALATSARGIASLRFTSATPDSSYRDSFTAYRMSKMLLSAARALTAMALGFGAWVHAAQDVNGGSFYGYIVGLIGGTIGWVVLGATEGNLSMIVDAAFVSFGIDQMANHGGHCQEADLQFGGLS